MIAEAVSLSNTQDQPGLDPGRLPGKSSHITFFVLFTSVCVCVCVCVRAHACSATSVMSDCLWPPLDCSVQAFLSMGFFRQECWSGLPRPPPGDLPDSGIERASPTWQADSLLLRYRRSPPFTSITSQSWIKWVLNIHRLKTDLANRCGMYFHWTRTSLSSSLYAFQHSLIIWWA